MKTYRVPLYLTTDPANKRGQIGEVIKTEDSVITLKFDDGTTGMYMDYCLIGIHNGKDLSEKQMYFVNEMQELLDDGVLEEELPKHMVSEFDGEMTKRDIDVAYNFLFEKEFVV